MLEFPDIKTIIEYGIFNVENLKLYDKNKLVKKNIKFLKECKRCSFIFEHNCTNCNINQISNQEQTLNY